MRGEPGDYPYTEVKLFESGSVRRRRVAAIAASVAIGLSGAAWAGCGDDEDDVEDAINEAVEAGQDQAEEIQGEVDEALDDAGVDGEDIEGEVEDAQEQAQDAIDEALEDAQ